MAWWNHVKNGISNGTARIGDHISSRYNRTLGHASGFLGGMNSYRQLMQSTETFYAKEMLDNKVAFKDLRTLSTLAAHINAFNEHRLGNIFSRYATKPKKLNAVVSKIVHLFSKDIKEFLQYYNQFINAINDELVKKAEEIHLQDDFVESLLKRLEQEIEHQEIYIPEKMIEKTKHEIKQLLKKEFKIDRREAKDDNLTETGHKVKTGLNFLSGLSWIKHKARKNLKKIHKDEHKDFVENLKIMEEQLNNHQVQPDFLARLIHHIDNLEHVVLIMDSLSRDIKRFIYVANKDYDNVKTSLAKFLAIFKNTDAVKSSNIHEELAELYRVHDNMKKVLEEDKLDEKKLAQHIKNISSVSNKMFQTIEIVSKLIMEHMEKNPDHYLRNMK